MIHLYPTAEDRCTMADLATNAGGFVQHLRETGRPLVLTAEGHEVAVVLSVEAFEKIRAAVEQPRLQRAIDEAERGIAAGRWVAHGEVEAKLKRWAGDGS